MKKQIDQLISEHTEGYQKYILKLSISDFKLLQRLMSKEYDIGDHKVKDYNTSNYANIKPMWKHDTTGQLTYGTVRFDNFELNVIKNAKHNDPPLISEVEEVDEMFWNSKKI